MKRMIFIIFIFLPLSNCAQISNAHESWNKENLEEEVITHRLKDLRESVTQLKEISDCVAYYEEISNTYNQPVKYLYLGLGSCYKDERDRIHDYSVSKGSNTMSLWSLLTGVPMGKVYYPEFTRLNRERFAKNYQIVKLELSKLSDDVIAFYQKQHMSQKELAELDSRYHQLKNDFDMPLYEILDYHLSKDKPQK